MTKKKRHHYIPRFYLKRFSINNEGKFLGLYHHATKKFISSAALRHQAYVNFLYGQDDEIENALAAMEETIARFFNFWTEEKLLLPPFPDTNAFKLLMQFILYQAFRTPKAGSDLMDSLNRGLKLWVSEFEPELREKIEGGKLVHDNPVLLRLLHSAQYQHLLRFLECRFLVNLSPLPFITSDAPVVFYNQLLEKAGNYMGATGLAAKGLQIFYPVHPRLMICLYDPEIYNFGKERDNSVYTESIEEIHQLNGLQLINSEAQIFFNESIQEEYITCLMDDFNVYRDHKKNVNKIIHQGKRRFFLTSFEDAQIKLELEFLSLKVNPANYLEELVPLRHPSLARGNNP